MRILLAVDGSRPSLDAVQSLVDHASWFADKPQVELLTVHLPVPMVPGMSAVVAKAHLQNYYHDEGMVALAEAKKRLEAANIRYTPHIEVGAIAETIVNQAKKLRCDLIYIGSRGMSAIGKALLGSTATKVLHIADVPVLLVK